MSSVFRNTFIKMLAIAAAMLLPAAAMAQNKNLGYVDSGAGPIVLSGVGACVMSGVWTPALAASAEACKQCTPDLCPKPPAPPPPPKPAPKPEVKPEPKPEVKPAPPAKPTPVNIELKIELQGIETNKTELSADNKKELDVFLDKEMANLKTPGSTIGAMIISGHSDKLGSEKYNKTLSEKRALLVKDYVVSKGIDPKVIFWEGNGSKKPIPVTKFCTNKMPRKQLIECLAPNRRVTVEVVGVWMKPPPKPAPEAKPEAKPAAKPAAKP
jgi:OmpA-OmpF porin, OOP family